LEDTGGLACSCDAHSGEWAGRSLPCVAGGGVAVPGAAGVGVLALGGGVVEPEGVSGDGGGHLQDELA
jgi:hypothetical protein